MIIVRRSNDRGHADHGWLDSYHTFSFAGYADPRHMGFRSLRVINEDVIAGGMGFGTHPHRDMEIITYVVDGELEHSDSMGNGEVIHPGEVQVMTAGSGITHSEFNHSKDQPVHLLQIWIKPERHGLTPAYAQRIFKAEEKTGKLALLAAPDAKGNALQIHQDARLYSTIIEQQEVAHKLADGRHAWVQVISGSVQVNGVKLSSGDGAAVSDENEVRLAAEGRAEVLLFDLA